MVGVHALVIRGRPLTLKCAYRRMVGVHALVIRGRALTLKCAYRRMVGVHQIRSDQVSTHGPPPLCPGAGLYATKEMNTTDEPDSILETKTTLLLVFKS